MPWKSSDAKRFSKKASSPRKAATWAKVANRELRKSGSEGRAVRIANYVVKRSGSKRGPTRRSRR